MKDSSIASYSHSNDKKPSPKDLQLLGSQLGGCQITDFIGRGGMGTVYKATHTALNREVAIKILSTRDQDEKAVEWFLREAQSIARLEHPNIIGVHDLSYDENLKVYFIVMQYINGPSLDILVKNSPYHRLPWKEAAEYIIQAASGLGAAHQKGIIHRDVKPSNIMITKEGQIKIADFGLAKGVVTEEASQTASVIVGTPLYMAPEQCVGSSIDHRADIYSLGAAFYYLVTGRSPIVGENTYEILEKQITEMPTPPDQLVEDLSPEIANIILRMLAKNPQERFQNCSDIVSLLSSMVHEKDITGSTSQPLSQLVYRVSGVDKQQMIHALKEIAYNRYQGTFFFRSREDMVILFIAEDGVSIFHDEYDMESLTKEYSQYTLVELVSLLLIQILSWESFTWEFAEEPPPEKDYLSVETDVYSLLLGYAGIVQILTDVSHPGALVLSTPLNSCVFLYEKSHSSVASPMPAIGEVAKALQDEEIEQAIGKIISGEYSFQYHPTSYVKIDGVSLQDSIVALYFEILYQMPDFTFFQHMLPNMSAIFPSDNQTGTKDLSLAKIKSMGEKTKKLLAQTFGQYQSLESRGVHKHIAMLITGSIIKERVLFVVEQIGTMACVFEKQGNKNTGDLLLEQANNLYPYSSKLIEKVAVINEESKHYERAAELWIRCGNFHQQKRDFGQAYSSYERAKELTPNDPAPMLAIFHMLLANDNTEEAIALSNEIIPKLRKAGNTDTLVEICHELLKIDPNMLNCYKELINYHLDLDQNQQAINLYEKVAEIHLRREEKADAIQTYQKILKLDPKRNDILDKIMLQEGKSRQIVKAMDTATTVINKVEKIGLGVAVASIIGAIIIFCAGREWYGYNELNKIKRQIELGKYEQIESDLLSLSEKFYFLGFGNEAFEIYITKKQEKNTQQKKELETIIENMVALYTKENPDDVTSYVKILIELDKYHAQYKDVNNVQLRNIINNLIKNWKTKIEAKKKQLDHKVQQSIYDEVQQKIREKNFLEAERLLDRLQSMNADGAWQQKIINARNAISDGQKQLNKENEKKEDEQEKLLKRAKEIDPNSDMEEILSAYQEVIKINPQNAVAKKAIELQEPYKRMYISAIELRKQAEQHENKQEYYQATLKYEEILLHPQLKNSRLARQINIPVVIATASLEGNSSISGLECFNYQQKIGDTPCVYKKTSAETLQLSINHKSFTIKKIEEERTSRGTLWKVVVLVERVPLWNFTTEGVIETSVIMHDQKLFFGSRDNNFYAIEKNGEMLWKYYTGRLSEITGSLQLEGNNIYFSTLSGLFCVLSTGDKFVESEDRVQWKTKIGGQIFQGGPFVYKRTAFLGSHTGTVYILTQRNRKTIVRKYETGDKIATMPVYKEQKLFVTTASSLQAFDLDSSSPTWKKSSVRFQSNPVVEDGVVYVATEDGIHAYRASNGESLWQYPITGGVFSTPAVYNGVLYCIGQEKNIYAINIRNGQRAWVYETEYGSRNSYQITPHIYKNIMFVGNDSGTIYAISTKNGKNLMRYNTNAQIYASPVCDGEILYIPNKQSITALWIGDIFTQE